MSCDNHPENEAVGRCVRCGRSLCAVCSIPIGGQTWCMQCLEALVARADTTRKSAWAWPSRAVAGLLSLMPGVGHMYLGLIGKGFALLGLLIASIFLIVLFSDATGMYWVTAYLVPTLSVLLLSYAVFDTMALASALRAGRALAPDPTMDAITERVLLNRRTSAYVMLVAGILGLLQLLERALGTLIPSLGPNLSATALVVPLFLVILGLRLLWRGRRPPEV